jgi:hypothetical protein
MGFGREHRTTLRALLGAALLHAAIAAVVLAYRPARAPREADAPPRASEVAIEIVADRSETEVARENEEAEAARASAAAAAPTPAPTTAAGLALAAPAEPAPVTAASGEQPAGPLTLLREGAPPAIGLALQGPNPFQAAGALPDLPRGAATDPRIPERAGPRAPTNAEAKQNAESVLREPARARERELGLGPDGPVLAALSEASSLGTTDVKGRAVFVAVADATGMVIGIDVLECDGGRAGWTSAAKAAHAALAGKKLRMPSTAKGARMRIEIVSEWKMPSGHDPGTDVSVLGVPVAKGEGKKSTSVELLNPLPKLETVELGPGVKVTVPIVQVTVIAVNGDPADIGARPRRVVHARLLDSQVL